MLKSIFRQSLESNSQYFCFPHRFTISDSSKAQEPTTGLIRVQLIFLSSQLSRQADQQSTRKRPKNVYNVKFDLQVLETDL
jgi:hypothetical protein